MLFVQHMEGKFSLWWGWSRRGGAGPGTLAARALSCLSEKGRCIFMVPRGKCLARWRGGSYRERTCDRHCYVPPFRLQTLPFSCVGQCDWVPANKMWAEVLYGPSGEAHKRSHLRLEMATFACLPSWYWNMGQVAGAPAAICACDGEDANHTRGQWSKRHRAAQSLRTLELQHTPWMLTLWFLWHKNEVNIHLLQPTLVWCFPKLTGRETEAPVQLAKATESRVRVCSHAVQGWSLNHLTDMARSWSNWDGCWGREWKVLLCLVSPLVANLCGVLGQELALGPQRPPSTRK